MNSFTQIEYLLIFHAFLYGFIAGEFFLGWGNIFRRKDKIRIYLPHFIWTVFGILLLVFYWWGYWLRAQSISNNIGYFYLSLITPVSFYFLSVYLFPKRVNDYESYFFKYKRYIYSLFALLLVTNLFLSVIFAHSDPIPYENYFRVFGATLFISSIFITSKKYHYVMSFVGLAILSFHHFRLSLIEIPPEYILIEGYSRTEYLVSFYAILFGVVSFEYFFGWGDLIRTKRKVKRYWVHVLWTVFTFALLIDLWWLSWQRSTQIISGFAIFFMAIIPPFIFYLGSVLLFPDFRKKKSRDMKTYFYANKNAMFITFAAYFAINIVASYLLGEYKIYPTENYFRAVGIVLPLIGVYVNKEWFHSIFVFAAIIILAIHHISVYSW